MATYSTTKSIGVNTKTKIKFYCTTTSTKTSTGGYTNVSAKVQIVPDGWYSASSWTATLDGKKATGGYTKWSSTTTLVSKTIKITHNSTGVCPKKTITFTYKDTYGATSQKSWSVTVGGSSSDVLIPNLVVTWPVTYTSSGTVSGMPSNQTKKYNVDLTLKTSTKPTRSGYKFLGWYDSAGKKYSSGAVYTKNAALALTAKWEKIEDETITYYTIEYESIGDTNNLPHDQLVAASSSYVISDTIPEKEGYIFTGWKDSGSTAVYQPEEIILNVTRNYTLVAQWAVDPAYPNYRITYNANGGLFYDGDEDENGNPITPVTSIYEDVKGYNIIITEEIPTKEDYDFAGWSKTSNGDVLYQPGDASLENSNVTLYAIWTQPEEPYKKPVIYKRVNGVWKVCTQGYYYNNNGTWIKNAPFYMISSDEGDEEDVMVAH